MALKNLTKKNENVNVMESEESENKVNNFDKSGSCCIVLLIVGDTCYISNVGDSRAVMSVELGKKAVQLSRDHKPLDEIEYKRINEAGGKIYQTKVQAYNNSGQNDINQTPNAEQQTYLVGPYRVLPGRLSVNFLNFL